MCVTRTELLRDNWDKGDKLIAQVGSLMDQGKCLLLLDCMDICENHDMIRSI